MKKESELESPVKSWLQAQGWIVHRESALYMGIPDLLAYHPYLDHFLSVELKIHRYRQALRQAINYLDCVHLSYIAMPENIVLNIIKNPNRREACVSKGIGLIGVGKEWNLRVYIEPVLNHAAQTKHPTDLYKRFKSETKKVLIGATP